MTFRKRKGQGKTVDRVLCRLLDALQSKYPGIGISPDDFWFQQGAYTHLHWDLARWGADIPIPTMPKVKIKLYSFDTMTQCAKGLVVMEQHRTHMPHEYEISSLT